MILLAEWNWQDWISPDKINTILRVALLIGFGIPLLIFFSRLAGRITKKNFSAQSSMLVRKVIFYAGSIILLITVLHQVGFNLTALLGAAGIVGIAIGFASQTSVSNIISGFFLIWEKPFEVGDVIKVGDTTGVVLSIDLMSLKLRTFDNLFVRIPNETLIKSQVTNVTRFPIRRFDLQVGVAYKEDVEKVRTVLLEVAKNNPLCLDEPEPLVIFQKYGDSALEFLFAVWFLKTDFLALRNSIMQEVKKRFDDEGIEIPFPHRTLYSGAVTDPFPIQIVDKKDSNSHSE